MKNFSIKTVILVFFGSLLCVSARAQCPLHNDKVVVVSHRGNWRYAAENSLEAFQSCVDMGVNMIELDLNKTKDGKLIILHDRTLDRTTTGKGAPSDYTLAEIKKMFLRNGCGVPTSQRVPTLEEVLKSVKGKIWVNIDKGYEYFDEVSDILKATGTTQQVIIKSEVPYQQIKREHPQVLTDLVFMPIVSCEDDDASKIIDEYLKELKPVAFEITFKKRTSKVDSIIRQIKDGGSKVWINTLWPSLCGGLNDDRAVFDNQEDETWGEVVRMGASIIQTDRPHELISFLKNRDLYIANQSSREIRGRLKNKDKNYIYVVSHRGDWLRYPENSLGAFKGAIQHGVDIIETDVQRTKDGVLVMSHDETVDRCTNGKGRIDEMTLAEIKQLRLKDRAGKITEYVIPTLEETMLFCKDKILLNLDKSDRFIDETMAVLRKTGTANMAILKSYMPYPEVVSKYGTYLSEVLYMPVINLDQPDVMAKLREFNEKLHPFAYEVNFRRNEDMGKKVSDMIDGSSLLWFNTLSGRNLGHDDLMSLSDMESGVQYVIDNYKANMIQTDIPNPLIRYLQEKGLR